MLPLHHGPKYIVARLLCNLSSPNIPFEIGALPVSLENARKVLELKPNDEKSSEESGKEVKKIIKKWKWEGNKAVHDAQ